MPPRWRSLSAPTRPRRWPRERAAAADRGAAPRSPEADQDGGRGSPDRRDARESCWPEALGGGRIITDESPEGHRRREADAASGAGGGGRPDSECARPGPDALRQGEPGSAGREGGRAPAAVEDLDPRLVIGIFGGSGFYSLLDDMTEVPVATPYGPPSAPVRVGTVEGTEVAFMPRHGDEHTLPPHRINYRANIWAMKEVGVDRIIGPSACGSLKAEIEPGTFVICDQFVDRTAARESTFYDGPQTTHVSAADPYCPSLRATLAECAREEGIPVVEGGTVVVIEGPRFSTRAESRWFAASGFDVVNMTQYPEAWLARELALCYANVSLVTDYDVGLEGMPDVEPVSADTAFRVFADNLDRLRALLFRAVPKIGPQPDDICASALDSAIVHH